MDSLEIQAFSRSARNVRPKGRVFLLLGVMGALVTLSACMSGGRAPVINGSEPTQKTVANKPREERIIPGADVPLTPVKPDHYRVVRGDTLYSIAWRYQLDYKQVARWNRIRSPYVIHVGQQIRLIPPPEPKRPLRPVPTEPSVVKKPAPANKPVPTKPVPQVVKKEKPASSGASTKSVSPPIKTTKSITPLSWQWPTKGKQNAKASSRNRQGIEIPGKMGQTVVAASGGQVVYSGSGLVGYGNLIIIKHSQSYLSAYAHNSRLLVAEGTQVAAGQPIAEMGNSGTNSVKLYFEIRKDGKTVNPRGYLP